MAGRKPGTPKTGGRKKGSLNKIGAAAKEVIASVAVGLGGADRLLEWIKEDPKNEAAYWERIYPKLLPLQLSGEGGGPIAVVNEVILSAPGFDDSRKD